MQAFFYGIAVLACPVGMGLMMWMMMRGQKNSGGNNNGGGGGGNSDGPSGGPDTTGQVAALRAEIDQLKADRATQRAPGGM